MSAEISRTFEYTTEDWLDGDIAAAICADFFRSASLGEPLPDKREVAEFVRVGRLAQVVGRVSAKGILALANGAPHSRYCPSWMESEVPVRPHPKRLATSLISTKDIPAIVPPADTACYPVIIDTDRSVCWDEVDVSRSLHFGSRPKAPNIKLFGFNARLLVRDIYPMLTVKSLLEYFQYDQSGLHADIAGAAIVSEELEDGNGNMPPFILPDGSIDDAAVFIDIRE